MQSATTDLSPPHFITLHDSEHLVVMVMDYAPLGRASDNRSFTKHRDEFAMKLLNDESKTYLYLEICRSHCRQPLSKRILLGLCQSCFTIEDAYSVLDKILSPISGATESAVLEHEFSDFMKLVNTKNIDSDS